MMINQQFSLVDFSITYFRIVYNGPFDLFAVFGTQLLYIKMEYDRDLLFYLYTKIDFN